MHQVPAVSVSDVPADLGDTVLIDVREPYEWEAGHVEGARHVPMGELPQRLEELPADTRLVIACRSGNRSGQVTQWLCAQGYDAVNLAGGMTDWAAAGKPLVDADGRPGDVA